MWNFKLRHFQSALAQLVRNWDALAPATRRLCLSAVIVIGICVTACRRDMQDQPRYDMYAESAFFNDRAAVRPLPEHTVPRGYLRADTVFYTGRIPGAARPAGNALATAAQGAAVFDPDLATTFPFPVTHEILDQGQNEFQTYCVECHGPTGEGDGIIPRRGYRKPPSYHEDRLRQAPVGHFFDVMTNGWGAMPSYSYLVSPSNRWAIAAYIRALQLSRSAKLDDLPPEVRQQLAGQVQARPAGQTAQPQVMPSPTPPSARPERRVP